MHQNTAHKKDCPFSCEFCDKCFHTSSARYDHQRTAHDWESVEDLQKQAMENNPQIKSNIWNKINQANKKRQRSEYELEL